MRGCRSTPALSHLHFQPFHRLPPARTRPSSMEVIAPFPCTEAAWATLPLHAWMDEWIKRFVERRLPLSPVITSPFGKRPIFPVGLNCNSFDAWSSEELKFTAIPSPEGGLDINIDSHVFHVRKHLSVLHPVVQMMPFASCDLSTTVISADECTFRCQKSMLPKGVLEMVKKSLSPRRTKETPEVHKCAAPGYGRSFAKGSVDFIGVTTDANSHQTLHCNGRTVEKNKVLKQSNTCCGDSASKPNDAVNLQQQQQQQQHQRQQQKQQHIGSVANGVHLWPSEVAPTHNIVNEDCLQACQWETMIVAMNWVNILRSMTCNNTLKGISPADYSLNEEPFVKDRYQPLQCTDNAPVINFTEQIGEPELRSGTGSNITKSTKSTSAAASTTWIVASAAPNHATGNRALLSDFTAEHNDMIFLLGGDEGAMPMPVIGRGSVVTETIVLPDVWYVPGLAGNLVSVSQLAEEDYIVAFGRGKCYIRSTMDGAVVGTAHAGADGLFAVDFLRVQPVDL